VFFERKLSLPQLWSPGATTVLNWPSWLGLLTIALAFLTIGLIILRITGKRRLAF
jgi:hypothetical protein